VRQLFISYARENKPDVEELVRDLDALGYQTSVDSSLRDGQTWWEEILRRITDSDAFMAIVLQTRAGMGVGAEQAGATTGGGAATGRPSERLVDSLPDHRLFAKPLAPVLRQISGG